MALVSPQQNALLLAEPPVEPVLMDLAFAVFSALAVGDPPPPTTLTSLRLQPRLPHPAPTQCAQPLQPSAKSGLTLRSLSWLEPPALQARKAYVQMTASPSQILLAQILHWFV